MNTRHALLAVAAVGFVIATVGADVVTGDDSSLAVGAVGWIVLWAGFLGAEYIAKNEHVDERFAQIHYRSGYFSWLVLLVLATLLLFTVDHLPWELSMKYTLVLLVGPTVVVYVVLADWYTTRM